MTHISENTGLAQLSRARTMTPTRVEKYCNLVDDTIFSNYKIHKRSETEKGMILLNGDTSLIKHH